MESVRAAADHATIRDLQLGIAPSRRTGLPRQPRETPREHLQGFRASAEQSHDAGAHQRELAARQVRRRVAAAKHPRDGPTNARRDGRRIRRQESGAHQRRGATLRAHRSRHAGRKCQGVVAKDGRLIATGRSVDVSIEHLARAVRVTSRRIVTLPWCANWRRRSRTTTSRSSELPSPSAKAPGRQGRRERLPPRQSRRDAEHLARYRQRAYALAAGECHLQLPLGPELKPVAALTTGRQPRDGQSLRAFLADRSKTAGCAAPADSSLSTGGPLALVDDEKEATINLDASEWPGEPGIPASCCSGAFRGGAPSSLQQRFGA